MDRKTAKRIQVLIETMKKEGDAHADELESLLSPASKNGAGARRKEMESVARVLGAYPPGTFSVKDVSEKTELPPENVSGILGAYRRRLNVRRRYSMMWEKLGEPCTPAHGSIYLADMAELSGHVRDIIIESGKDHISPVTLSHRLVEMGYDGCRGFREFVASHAQELGLRELAPEEKSRLRDSSGLGYAGPVYARC